MTIQARLFYAGRQQYQALTAKDVEDYYAGQKLGAPVAAYEKQGDVCVITKTVAGKQVIATKISASDTEAAEQVEVIKDSMRFEALLDGLLQFVYERLKAG